MKLATYIAMNLQRFKMDEMILSNFISCLAKITLAIYMSINAYNVFI